MQFSVLTVRAFSDRKVVLPASVNDAFQWCGFEVF